MSLTAAAANDLLDGIDTAEGLRALIAQLDVSTHGSTTVLYSGWLNDTVETGDVISEMKKDPSLRILDNTEAFKFLDVIDPDSDTHNAKLYQTLVRIFGDNPEDWQNNSASNQFLFGAKNGDVRSPDGVFDIVSANFAKEAVGDVIALVPKARADRVFAASELPELLANSKVTSVNGIPKDDLLAAKARGGLLEVFTSVKTVSFVAVAATGLADSVKVGDVTSLSNLSEYVSNANKDLETYLDAHPPAKSKLIKCLNELEASNSVAHSELAAQLNHLRDVNVSPPNELGAPKILNKLGAIGTAVGLLLVSGQAGAATLRGDKEGAKKIIEDWAVDAAGSAAGEAIAAVVVGLGAGALVTAGVLTAPVAAAIVLGATVVGGILGSDAAEELYDLFDDRDGSGKRDIIDRIEILFYGQTYSLSDPIPSDISFGVQRTISTNLTADQLVANAKTDIAWRYALRELNPFVIENVSYDKHNEDGSLDLFDEDNKPNGVTEEFLKDRAEMLIWKMKFDQKGAKDDNDILAPAGHKPYDEEWDSNTVQGNWDYVDHSRPIPGLSGPLTLAIDGVGLSLSDHQIIFGKNKADQADNLLGDGDDDRIYARDGNDTVGGGKGNDYVEGNAGNDSLDGGEGRDTLIGGTGEDKLDGGSGVDLLKGLDGGDTIKGGLGNDVVYGGGGADDLSGDEDGDFVNGGTGSDILKGGTGNDYLYDVGGAELNTLKGEQDNDVLEVGGGAGNALLNGGSGNDLMLGSKDGSNSIDGGDGNDVIVGGDAYDIIKGEDGADNIEAGGGGDLITGGAGADYMRGNAGSDNYVFDAGFGTDLISDDSGSLSLGDGDSLSGGAYQENSLAFEGNGYEYRKFQIGGFSALMINAKGDEKNTIFIDRWQDGQLGISLSGQEEEPVKPNITPTTANALPENNKVDVIRSDGGDGGQGNDILIGTGSTSLLSGGTGNDILDGRDGDDWLEGGEGSDLILTGKGADVAYGGGGDDIIRVGYTLDWYDTTLAGTGEDALFFRAGSGFDPVAGTNTQDPFIYYVNGVEYKIAHPQMAVFDFKFVPEISHSENYDGKLWWWHVGDPSVSAEPSLDITVTLGDPENVTPGANLEEAPSSNLGKGIDYKVFLGAAKDILQASTGEKGARGWGGDGNDILYGGNESDKLHGDADNDVLVGYDGADELHGDAGEDELSGGNGRDFLDGGSENDTLVGGLGADVLSGGTGNDELIGDAMYLKGTNWFPAGLDESKMGGDLLYGGAGNDKLWGNNGDDYLFGGLDNDTISGGADNDHLLGDENDDVLMGGGGDDYLDGGSGNDTLYDDANGKDERGQENKSHDILFGRAGDDDLDGGAGDDILDGGDDNDILTGGDGNDILRGGAGKDRLYGDNGAKTPGMDILEGGAGDDELNGGGGSDMYVFNLGDGKDTIQDDGSSGSHNVVVFKFSTTHIKTVTRDGQDLVISYGASDSVTVKGYYGGGFSHGYTAEVAPDPDEDQTPQAAIAQICFEDGTVWSRDDIYELAPPPAEPIVDQFAAANLTYFVNALLSRETVRSAGKHALTYSFAESFSGGESNAYLFTDEQKVAVRAALAKFSAVIDVTFTEVDSNEDSDLRYILDDLTSADSGAFAGYASSQNGEIHLNSNLFARQYANEFGELHTQQTLNEGEFGFEVLLHETAHALGLKHPFELPLLPGAENNNANTVMSYTRTVEPARQLAAFDVAALQFFYGVARDTKKGNDTYTFADKFVYDASGFDTFDAMQETEDVNIDLGPGGWSYVGERNASILAPQQSYIGHGTYIENAFGGRGNDRLLGNARANGFIGGDGDDTIVGNKGNDLLLGDAGIDTYIFNIGDGQDTIIDAEGLSRIELNGVTAEEVYWDNGYLYYGQKGDRIAVDIEMVGELVIGNVSYVGQAIDDALRIVLGTAGSESLSGGEDADRLRGLDGDDTLSGQGGMDSIEGNGGNDVLQGGSGADLLDGGVDDDALHGDADDDVMFGGAGDDSLYGGAGADVLDGGADNDVLQGGADNDALDGGAGNDVILGDAGGDSLYGGAGDDVLDGGSGNDVLFGGTGTEAGGGNDTFRFARGGGQDTIYESIGDGDQDKIQMIGLSDRELAFSLVGNDLLISIIGTEDRLLVSRYFEDSARTIENIELADGVSLTKNDVYSRLQTNYIGGSGNDYLSGNSLNNRLEGNEGNDTLVGGAGRNLFIGGRGNDSMYGGSGKDTYVFNLGDGQDLIEDGNSYTVGGAADQLVFGPSLTAEGIIFSARSDLLPADPRFVGINSNDLIITFASSPEQLVIREFFSYGRIENFMFSDGSQVSASEVLERVKRTTGTEAAEMLRGGDAADDIDAKAGDDIIRGFAGNDTIYGGEGKDRIDGGEGDDLIVGGVGWDSLYGQDGNDTLVSSGGDYVLDGGAGNDLLDVGVGGDSKGRVEIRGAVGSDRYVLHTGMGYVSLLDQDLDANAVDTIEFADLSLSDVQIKQNGYVMTIKSLKHPGDYIDIYRLWSGSSATPSLPSPESVVDFVRFADGSRYTIEQIIQVSLQGTSSGDSLRGTRANDTLSGGDGADMLWGHLGDDLLLAGQGDDTLNGGGDYSRAGDGVNTLVGGAGNDLNIGGNGDDTFVFGRGDGSDTIDSYDTVGNDTLKFGAGVLPEHVQLYRDNADLVAVIDGSSTQTRIKSFFNSANLPVEQILFENGTVWSSATMQELAITGSVDQLTGTAGNDVFVIDNASDTLTEAADAGIDEVRSSVSYLLPWNVENFTATGVLNLTIQGNNADNVLRGNGNDNEFRSGGGSDRALGGLGDDTYYIESSGVLSVEEYAGEGNDTLRQVDGSWGNGNSLYSSLFYSVTLPENVENLILGKTSSRWLTYDGRATYARGGYGNALDNLIIGESGSENLLDGYGGRDTLVGGGKVDVYRVDREDDIIIDSLAYDAGTNESVRTFPNLENLFARGDLVESSAVRYTLGENLEHLYLVGADAMDGAGNALDNAIVGNWNANRIEGGAGNDRLYDGPAQTGWWGAPAAPGAYSYDNDTLIGGDGNDQITAYNGDDRLEGGTGDDMITAAGGLATLIGGKGNDTLEGSGLGAVYRYAQGDGNDTVRVVGAVRFGNGADSRDRLVFEASVLPDQVSMARTGEEGANLLLTLADGGSVLLEDYFYVTPNTGYRGRAMDRIEFADGTTWSRNMVDRYFGLPTDPEGTSGNDLLTGTPSRNILFGLAGDDTLLGGDGNDQLEGGDGNDLLDGGLGNDILVGGMGDDVYRDEDASMQIIEAADGGIDTLEVTTEGYLWDNVEIGIVTASTGGTIYGSAQTNTLIGNAGDDALYGDDGNDQLSGHAGADWLDGGMGNDVFLFNKGDGQDSIEAFDLQSAVDTLRIGALDSEVMAERSNNLLLIKIKNSTDQISVIDYYAAASSIDSVSWDHKIDRIEFINGTVWDKTMIQSVVDRAKNNRAPTVSGSIPALIARQDSLFSYTVPVATITDPDSWDSITYSVRMPDGSSVPAWLNFDPVTRVLSGTPAAANLGNLQFILWGTDNYGYAAGTYVNLKVNPPNTAPVLASALPDQNAYEGAAFSYTVASGAFTDPDAGDTLSYSASLADGSALPAWLSFNASTRAFTGTPPAGSIGKVSVRVTARDTGNLSVADVFDVTISVANLTKTGTSAAETLTGGSGNDTLSGAGGNDTLYGQAGNDRLDGGTGSDRLIGGVGDDLYVVDVSGDVIVENAGEGTDLVQSSITYTLAANVENLTLTGTSAINGTGNSGNNLLTGNSAVNSLSGGAGNDTLNGGAGADSLIGGAGDDLYVVDNTSDKTTENAGEGNDTVQSSVTWTLAANLENLTLTGTTAINGTGNASANVLRGNAAANTLNGSTGIDTLIGGAGNDSYVVDNIGDQVIENANEGTDSVSSTVAYTLSAHVENLTLSGTSAINGTGNDLANSLTGNSAVNTLNGGAGNDTLNGGTGADSLVGGMGDDVYIVDNTSDKVVENANEGTDSVQSRITHTLAANVENLTLTGTSAINGTGNTGHNLLTGNSAVNTLNGGAGNDTLNGGAGADSLIGGAGDDVYIVDNTSDKVVESPNEGTDTVQSSITHTLAANVENLMLTGTTAINGIGNTSANVLTGNAANNTLTGGGGNDTYRGGVGTDTLTASSTTSNDTYIWGRGEGADTLTDAGGADQLSILAGVTAEQVWLRRASNNLEVSVIGTTDRFTITNWYASSANQVESLRLSDNRALSASKVQGLVDAMAAFSPPAQGQTTLPTNYQTSLNTVIATNWV